MFGLFLTFYCKAIHLIAFLIAVLILINAKALLQVQTADSTPPRTKHVHIYQLLNAHKGIDVD